MIAEIKLPLDWVKFRIGMPAKRAQIAKVRNEVLEAVGREFDSAVAEAKKQWKAQK